MLSNLEFYFVVVALKSCSSLLGIREKLVSVYRVSEWGFLHLCIINWHCCYRCSSCFFSANQEYKFLVERQYSLLGEKLLYRLLLSVRSRRFLSLTLYCVCGVCFLEEAGQFDPLDLRALVSYRVFIKYCYYVIIFRNSARSTRVWLTCHLAVGRRGGVQTLTQKEL